MRIALNLISNTFLSTTRFHRPFTQIKMQPLVIAALLGFALAQDVPGATSPIVTTGSSNQPAATNTQTATQDACAKKCTDAFNACIGQPGGNTTCASAFAGCLGYDPDTFTPVSCASQSGSATTSGAAHPTHTGRRETTKGAVVTAAAAVLEPSYALYALGALALL